MALTETWCPICAGRAYRNAAGKLLRHTRYKPWDYGEVREAEVCPGSTPGAKPDDR